MIISYCIENRVAIYFDNQEERDLVNAKFGRYEKNDCLYGWLSHYKQKGIVYCSSTFQSSFKKYAIISSQEFLQLSDENSSTLELVYGD